MSDRAGHPKTLPGEVGLWVFIIADLLLFTLYFVLALIDRMHAPDVFRQGRSAISLDLGTVNTLVLLTGSWAVMMGTRVTRDHLRASRYLALAALAGIIFLLVKSFEWYELLRAGHAIDTNAFYTWYFFLTGFHALHVMAATVFLAAIAARLNRGETVGPVLAEAAGCYWHLVDLLWIGIFLVLYLI